MNKRGFALLAIFVLGVVFLAAIGGSYFYKNKEKAPIAEPVQPENFAVVMPTAVSKSKPKQNSQKNTSTSPSQQNVSNSPNSQQIITPQNTDEPPLKLKSIGVNLSDFIFTREKLQFNRIFMGFGFVIPSAMTSTGQAKWNPQPTFVLPLGTPVRSLVDGVVVSMPTLWSGDISIQVTADGKMGRWIYETEHVINPKVKVGEAVKAGQVIAEVGSFGNGDPSGFGAVEIGILKGGVAPAHVCPFAYLDESIKDETLAGIKDLFNRWETYVADTALYDPSEKIPGCLTLEPING